jgi:hypothetical protein
VGRNLAKSMDRNMVTIYVNNDTYIQYGLY